MLTSPEYLRDLAERLMHVPVMYGVDQSDVAQLRHIAERQDRLQEEINRIERERNAPLDHNLGDD